MSIDLGLETLAHSAVDADEPLAERWTQLNVCWRCFVLATLGLWSSSS